MIRRINAPLCSIRESARGNNKEMWRIENETWNRYRHVQQCVAYVMSVGKAPATRHSESPPRPNVAREGCGLDNGMAFKTSLCGLCLPISFIVFWPVSYVPTLFYLYCLRVFVLPRNRWLLVDSFGA